MTNTSIKISLLTVGEAVNVLGCILQDKNVSYTKQSPNGGLTWYICYAKDESEEKEIMNLYNDLFHSGYNIWL